LTYLPVSWYNGRQWLAQLVAQSSAANEEDSWQILEPALGQTC
jgi:hypothetical protein